MHQLTEAASTNQRGDALAVLFGDPADDPARNVLDRRTHADPEKRVLEPVFAEQPDFGLKPDANRIQRLQILDLSPSPENDKLYRPPDPNDPEFLALVASIRTDGIREPLVVTQDGYIVSGHRRFAAAEAARLDEVPARVLDYRRNDDPDRFIRELREHNRQRVKAHDELLREAVVDVSREEAYADLVNYRNAQQRVALEPMKLGDYKARKTTSSAKTPFLDAVKRVLRDNHQYLPLSVRRIHYVLAQHSPPLMHARKPKSVYRLDDSSWRQLVKLTTDARHEGSIPWEHICDPTRPVTLWRVWPNTAPYVREQLDGLFKGYCRDFMQSQPNHVEIVCEKNTIEPLIRPLAAEYTIPMTVGRGFCSGRPRFDMAQRFRQSGKGKLVLLLITDFDPDGECIAESFARSMRDDFGLASVHAVKAALTAEQVRTYGLPAGGKAKKGSPRYKAFVKKHGHAVYELEALEPATLQAVVHGAIEAVIDVNAFNAEQQAERDDAAYLAVLRRRAVAVLSDLGPEDKDTT